MSSPNPTEYRHLRTGSLNIPPPNGHSGGMMSPMPGPQRFDGPRSPPSKPSSFPSRRRRIHFPSGAGQRGDHRKTPAAPLSRRRMRILRNGLALPTSYCRMLSFLTFAPRDRYITCSLQVLPTRSLSSWQCLPFQPRPRRGSREHLQVLRKGT